MFEIIQAVRDASNEEDGDYDYDIDTCYWSRVLTSELPTSNVLTI